MPLAIELAASRMQSMTVTELRDRLDDRFRLLTGSRRGLERHHTLRHAVEWSYDLLTEAPKSSVTVCSVFAGGFDLAGAAGWRAMTTTRNWRARCPRPQVAARCRPIIRSDPVLDAGECPAVRRIPTGRGRAANEARAAHARHFASLEAAVLATWDSARQGEAYTWLNVELANLRAAFRWASDHDQLDIAAAIAIYSTMLGSWEEQSEPVRIKEVIAAVGSTPILASRSSTSWRRSVMPPAESSRPHLRRPPKPPSRAAARPGSYEAEAWIGGAYITVGQPERWASPVPKHDSTRRRSPLHGPCEPGAGRYSCPVAKTKRSRLLGLLAAGDATDNPYAASSPSWRSASPVGTPTPPRHTRSSAGPETAQDSGNRQVESHLAVGMSRLAATHGDPTVALDYFHPRDP